MLVDTKKQMKRIGSDNGKLGIEPEAKTVTAHT